MITFSVNTAVTPTWTCTRLLPEPTRRRVKGVLLGNEILSQPHQLFLSMRDTEKKILGLDLIGN